MWSHGVIIPSILFGFNPVLAEPNATWQVEPSMAVARDQFAGGVIGQYLFVFGGNGNPGGVNLKSTEAFDIEGGEWSFRADNEHNDGWGVEELTAAVADGRLYVFGAYGGTAPDGYYGVFNFNEMYDPVTDTWTTRRKNPRQPRRGRPLSMTTKSTSSAATSIARIPPRSMSVTVSLNAMIPQATPGVP